MTRIFFAVNKDHPGSLFRFNLMKKRKYEIYFYFIYLKSKTSKTFRHYYIKSINQIVTYLDGEEDKSRYIFIYLIFLNINLF